MPTITFSRDKIVQVTPDGITYRDDDGQTAFIDFMKWAENNPYRYVGRRDCSAARPYFEFATEPPTRFLFPAPGGDFVWFERQIRRAGWMTIDLA